MSSQSYFFKVYKPFDQNIPSPEEFLACPIGRPLTRHDRIVAYLDKLVKVSDQSQITGYGRSYEHRELVNLAYNVHGMELIGYS